MGLLGVVGKVRYASTIAPSSFAANLKHDDFG